MAAGVSWSGLLGAVRARASGGVSGFDGGVVDDCDLIRGEHANHAVWGNFYVGDDGGCAGDFLTNVVRILMRYFVIITLLFARLTSTACLCLPPFRFPQLQPSVVASLLLTGAHQQDLCMHQNTKSKRMPSRSC